jgi:hypothetical protein
MAPLLEQDIEALQTLDEQRERCRSLVEGASGAILEWVRADAPADNDDWESAEDDVERAMVLRSLNLIKRDSLVSLTESDLDKMRRLAARRRRRLLATTIESLYKERSASTDSDQFDRIPVFRACHVFQALAEDDHQDSGPFSAASLNCLYRMMAEIYRIDGPGWKAGGVRASRDAPQSSFVTREAVRSILLIHKLLINTRHLLLELGESKEAYTNGECAPTAWRTHISQLQRRSFEISLRARWPHLLDRSMEIPLEENWAATVSMQVADQLRRHWRTFVRSRQDFHVLPAEVVPTEVHNRVTELVGAIFEELSKGTADLEAAASAMQKAAARVVKIVEPCKSYLEGVLIAELSAEPGRSAVEPDAAQTAFAAAALAEIDKAAGSSDPGDLRLLAATRLASGRLSERSALPAGAPFDTSGKGYRLPPQRAETIRAICDMFRYSTAACEPETARRLVRYFLETRTDRPGAQGGWHSDTGTRNDKAAVWATALALLALLDLRSMLDQQINHRILDHFTVRDPKKLKLELHQLFIPDVIAARKVNERSIGRQLQEMRAHVEGTTSAGDNFSVVLYGPPGTGKTTLIEALARSAASHLVEITPSDILIGGSEQVERHTRLVFSALSMLTRCVILFDEFDSILYKRTRGTPLTQFQFLTPGLLPKFKLLHDRAAKQQLAYALATNFVGDLDRAATRTGRFDQRLGVFPPDVLSRVGRLATEMQRYCDKSGRTLTPEEGIEAIEVIDKSAGYGMATIGKPGWFTVPRRDPEPGTPFGHIFLSDVPMPDFGHPEAEWDSKEPNANDDPLGHREWQEWRKVIQLDGLGKEIRAASWQAFIQEVERLSG